MPLPLIDCKYLRAMNSGYTQGKATLQKNSAASFKQPDNRRVLAVPNLLIIRHIICTSRAAPTARRVSYRNNHTDIMLVMRQ